MSEIQAWFADRFRPQQAQVDAAWERLRVTRRHHEARQQEQEDRNAFAELFLGMLTPEDLTQMCGLVSPEMTASEVKQQIETMLESDFANVRQCLATEQRLRRRRRNPRRR